MALSKETVFVYITYSHNETTSTDVYSALMVSTASRKPLFSRLETALRQTCKGSRLRHLSLSEVDERTEKIAGDVLMQLFSSNLAYGQLIRFAPTSSAKNAQMLSFLLKKISSVCPDAAFSVFYSPDNLRASVLNNALKKSGIRMSVNKDEIEDSIGLSCSLFLGELFSDPKETHFALLHNRLDSQLKRNLRFQAEDGDLIYLSSMLSPEAYPLAKQASLLNKELPASGLLDKMAKKKSGIEEYEALLAFLKEGGDPVLLAEAQGSRIAQKIENLKKEEAEKEKEALSNPSTPVSEPEKQENSSALDQPSRTAETPKIRSRFEYELENLDLQMALSQFEVLSTRVSELISEKISLKSLFEESWNQLEKQIHSSLPEQTRKPKERKHIFFGCFKNPETSQVRVTALIPYYYERSAQRAVKELERISKESFSQTLKQAAEDSEFKQWLNSSFLILSAEDETEDYYSQLKELIQKAAELFPSLILHMSLLTGQDLKAVLIDENWYLPYVLEKEKDQPLLKISRLAAALNKSRPGDQADVQPDSDSENQNRDEDRSESENNSSDADSCSQKIGPSFMPFITDPKKHARLRPMQKRILASPWLNTPMTKRMADAFGRGLSPMQVSFVMWNETGKKRDWMLRSLLLEYLYPARTRSFLNAQMKKRSLDEYDFLSYPGFSLEKMQAIAETFDLGYPLAEYRKRITQKSTLKAIEQEKEHFENIRAEKASSVLSTGLAEDEAGRNLQAVLLPEDYGHEIEELIRFRILASIPETSKPAEECTDEQILEKSNQILIALSELVNRKISENS